MQGKRSRELKGREKEKEKGKKNNWERVMAKKKKSKFWLMRMHRIETLHNFVPKPWEIHPFW